MDMQSFADQVRPLAEALRGISLDDADQARSAVEQAAPIDGELVQSIREAAMVGAEEGWLLPNEKGGVHFGRVAKDLAGFSVDAVRMDGPGPKHRHPRGEIDLCFAVDGEPAFDGKPQGWVVYGEDSAHVPTVRDGTMLILYFLPGGEIEWLR